MNDKRYYTYLTGGKITKSFHKKIKNKRILLSKQDLSFCKKISVTPQFAFLKNLSSCSYCESRLDIVINHIFFNISAFKVSHLLSHKKVKVNGNIVYSGS